MRILQINIQKSKNSTVHLFNYLIDNPDTLVLITEPYWYKDSIPGTPRNFRILGTPNSRAVIAAPSHLPLFLSNELSAPDHTVACFVLGEFTQYFASIYLDITKDCITSDLLNICHFLQRNDFKAVLGLDTNSHSPLWGCDEVNARGQKIEELIMEYQLTVLNKGNLPTFVSSRGSSIIDVTLAYGSTDHFQSWHVRPDYWMSDHRCIEFQMKTEKVKSPTVRCIDWSKFRESINPVDSAYNLWTPETIEKEAAMLERIIKDALHVSTYFRPIRPKQKGWFSPDLQTMKNKVIALHRIMIHSKNCANARNDFLEASKSFKYACKRAKRKSWRTFCDKVTDQKSMIILNKCLNKTKPEDLGLLKNPDGGFAKSPHQTIDILTKVHFPGCQPLKKAKKRTSGTKALMCNDNTEFLSFCSKSDLEKDSFITKENVAIAINSFQAEKVGGLDNFSPMVLQKFILNEVALKRLTTLFQAIIHLGYNPKHWCASKVVFIPKPKRDYSDPKSFRPISLMTFFMKTVEKLALWNIEQTALKDRPLSSAQHAFRKNFSCDTAISSLVDKVEKLILREKMALAVFLDVQGAFDNTPYNSIIKAMYDRKISPKIINWYKNFLQNRTATVEYKGIDHTVQVTKGTAQGGILSPLAWNLVFESFIDLYKSGPVSIGAFADDACLLVGGVDYSSMRDVMQGALTKATNWSTKEGLTFVPSKSHAVFFHRKKQITLPNELKLNGVPIKYVKETKYLGVVLDQRLSWKSHINQKINNAKRSIMRVKSAIGATFGPIPKMIAWAFKGVILPSLTYGNIVWSRVCEDGRIRQRLSTLNRLIALCMSSIRQSTPTAGLEVLLNLPPLDIKIKELSLCSMLRILPHRTPSWDGVGKRGRGHLLWGSKSLKDLKVNNWNFDSTNILNLNKKFEVDFNSFHSGTPHSDSEVNVFTDGSKLEGKAGYGFCYFQNNTLIDSGNGYIGNNQTVFQAEIVGIHKACERLSNSNAKSITIFSDSQSAICALAGWKVRSKTVANCVNTLNDLCRVKKVTLKYIKAHVGWHGNELADENAKLGTKNVQNLVEIPQPNSWAKQIIRQASYQEWCHRWYYSKIARQTKIWFPSLNLKSPLLLINLPRMELGLVIQMITGHNRLNRHENLCNQDVSPTCRFCSEEEETSWHIIGECPVLYNKRWRAFNTPFLEDPPVWRNYQLLRFMQLAKISELNKRENLASQSSQ